MKKRLGILVVYDQDGIVDKSKEYLLDSLSEILNRLIVAVNGNLTDESYHRLTRYTREIFLRSNEGYDAGAYKDVLLHYLGKEEIQEYDELLLLNDTFYGPFYSWSRVFSRMESMPVDFWGLTKHLAFFSSLLKMHVPEHIQSYFLLFRKQLLTSDVFFEFWESMKPVTSFPDAVKNFEIRLTPYFSNAGFSYGVYTDLYSQLDFLHLKDTNLYISNCFDLLRDCEFPILKKKGGVSALNPQTIPAIKYIKDHYAFDIDALWKNAKRTLKTAKLYDEIENFYNRYRRIYIYGCGITAQQIEAFFANKQWEIDGYLETVPHAGERNGKPVMAWKDFQLREDEGIIVGMDKTNTDEVRPFLPRTEAVLFLN